MNGKPKAFAICLVAMLWASAAQSAYNIPIKGWLTAGSNPEQYTFGKDTSGSINSAYIRSKDVPLKGFGTLMQQVAPDNYSGKRVRLSGQMKTADADFAQMWMRVDGRNGSVLEFDNMDSRPVKGTTDWKAYTVVLDVPKDSKDIAFGFFLQGKGEVWAKSFKLETVGPDVPVTPAPFPKAPVNMDFSE